MSDEVSVVIADLNGLQVHLGIVVHHVNERALLAILNRHVGDHELIGQRIHQQPDVDELLREKRIVLVVEDRLELGSAGGVVDLVVERSSAFRKPASWNCPGYTHRPAGARRPAAFA